MNMNVVVANHQYHRIIEFNFFPASDLDDSWWPSEYLPATMFKRLIKINTVRRRLSDFILQSYQLDNEVYSDFSTAEKQAALLSSADLKVLLYLMGLMIESDTIANVIERDAQHAIKQSLGAEDYLYILKNRISMGSRQSATKTVSANRTAYDFSDFKRRAYQDGLQCLLSLLDDMPQGFIQRVLFKLPKTWSASSVTTDKDRYRDIRNYLPRLFKELKLS